MAVEKGIVEPEQTLVRVALTPMDLLQMAVSQNLDVEKLERLMQLQREWKKDQAREAFVEAMNAFKKSPPVIAKNKHVKITPKDPTKYGAEYDHATLDNVCDKITKALSAHGISHRWTIDDSTQPMKVTCVLTHELGHSEETAMRGNPDETGSKNALQARSSTVTYLERYTLLAATGLATGVPDDDGNGGTNGELDEQIEYLQNARNLDELKSLYIVARKMFESNTAALKRLIAAKDARKQELS